MFNLRLQLLLSVLCRRVENCHSLNGICKGSERSFFLWSLVSLIGIIDIILLYNYTVLVCMEVIVLKQWFVESKLDALLTLPLGVLQ